MTSAGGRALQATTNNVISLLLRHALRVVGTGAVIGLVLAGLGGRLIATMLFGVRPLDPTTLVLVGAVLAVTAGLSIGRPAWRPARIDPAVALRSS